MLTTNLPSRIGLNDMPKSLRRILVRPLATGYVWSWRFLRRWVAAGYEAIMRYVRLAGTDLDVSTVALGCGNFGGIGSVPELFGLGEDEAAAFARSTAGRCASATARSLGPTR